MLFKSKTYEIDLAVQKKQVATLEGRLKLAETETSRARGKLDDLTFHNAKAD